MTAPAHSLDARALLRMHGLRPKRSLGQNFLQDSVTLQRIVDAAGIGVDDTVLEIGCGLGSLTGFLGHAAQQVLAIEVDARLAAIAEENLRSFDNVQILRGDFLELDLTRLRLPAGYVVAANIPYYVTSPILRKLLEAMNPPRRIALTVQKEVAYRICADPPRMSILAVSVQVYGEPQVLFEIPAHAFHPAPDVDSAVVRIDYRPATGLALEARASFFRLVRAGFAQPRKKLRNSLAAGLGITAPEVEALLSHVDIDPHRRAETLTVAEWVRLIEPFAGAGEPH